MQWLRCRFCSPDHGSSDPARRGGTVEKRTDPVDTAWRIHEAQVDWTGKVDSKASFALAIESGILVTIINLAGKNRRLSNIKGVPLNLLFWSGITLLVLSLLCVAWVVRPRLRPRLLVGEWPQNYIYFGHAQHWKPEKLEKALADGDILLPMLSRQIVSMAKIAWLKHRLLQWSMTGTTAGGALVALTAILKG
jgi:Family of unknown function (DUF5706)